MAVWRDKVNLDIFWLKDHALDDPDLLPTPDAVAAEIVESLETALERFRIAEHSAVIPRESGESSIPETLARIRRSRSVLGRPVEPGDDSGE